MDPDEIIRLVEDADKGQFPTDLIPRIQTLLKAAYTMDKQCADSYSVLNAVHFSIAELANPIIYYEQGDTITALANSWSSTIKDLFNTEDLLQGLAQDLDILWVRKIHTGITALYQLVNALAEQHVSDPHILPPVPFPSDDPAWQANVQGMLNALQYLDDTLSVVNTTIRRLLSPLQY